MRKAAFAVLFSCAAIIGVCNATTVNAEALDIDQIVSINKTANTEGTIVLSQIHKIAETKAEAEQEATTPTPTVYEVKPGDSLATIAEQHQTTWKRLYDKNEQLTNPDTITVGLKLIIPKADEVVTERALPQPQPVAAPVTNSAPSTTTSNRSTGAVASVQARGSVAGNGYAPGWCTWHAKNMRPDLPNNLGNANTWVARAAAQGYATGTTPAPGAIGQQGMHVVYVLSVNGDGTVTISDMNYAGLYVVTVRTVPANSFVYIY